MVAEGADLADMANVWVSDVMYRRCTRCLFLIENGSKLTSQVD